MKRSKKLKTTAAAMFIAVTGVCYAFFFPKEDPKVEIVKGEEGMVSLRPTGTDVPTPTAAGLPSAEQPQTSKTSPAEGPLSATPPASSSAEEARDTGKNGRININTASLEELMTLQGIGEKRAESIIEYRNAHGGFKQPEELMQVKGIKEGIYSKIRDRIGVE